MITAQQQQLVIDHLTRIGARKIGIFGSLARGENNADSDLDILLFLDKGDKTSLLTLIGAEQSLSDELGMKVDLVTERSLNPLVRPYVEKDLKIIFE